jgi:hypothetical protein
LEFIVNQNNFLFNRTIDFPDNVTDIIFIQYCIPIEDIGDDINEELVFNNVMLSNDYEYDLGVID